jgi:hypothetical protein
MRHRLPHCQPWSSQGDFYAVPELCTACGLPHDEAPELMNDPGDFRCPTGEDFKCCFFRRQPQTPEEVGQAIWAVAISETRGLRYGGSDQDIIRRLHELGCGDQCDQPLSEPPAS